VSREAEDLLWQLVSIESVNPTLVPGGAGEAEIAAFVAHWLERAGLDVRVDEAAPGRPNVIATAKGRGSGRTLLLNAHTDTVGLGGPDASTSPRVEDGRLYGRGAYDMKGALAAIMLVAAEAVRSPFAGDLILAAVADEEAASIGTEALVTQVAADAAIVVEPTELRVGIAHKGFVCLELETHGRAAHGSRYDLGIDAIALMGHVLVGLDAFDKLLRSDGQIHPLLGGGSLHASLIEGGQELSSYPAMCVLQIERRTLPGETMARVQEEVRAAAGEIEVEIRPLFERDPYEASTEEPIVSLLREHAGDPDVIGLGFWTDAALLGAAGVPTVVFGPGGEGAHADVEWVSLADVNRCAEVVLATAAEFCS
jgi:acetylornithine deacetylase